MSNTILPSNILVSSNSQTSQISSDQTLKQELDSQQQQQASQSNSYGPPYILDISQAAFPFLNGSTQTPNASAISGAASAGSLGALANVTVTYTSFGSASSASAAQSTDSSAATAQGASPASGAAGNIDQLLQFIEQILANAQDSLQSDTSTAASAPASAATTASIDPNAATDASATTGANATPVEQFLTRLESNPNLTDAQKQAVQNIAAQFQDASATPDTFKQVHDALKQAGVPVGHHGGGHHHHGGGAPAPASTASTTTSSTTADSTDPITQLLNLDTTSSSSDTNA